nr:hypothetical protein [Pseudonocardia sp. AL041005-10]
MDSRSPAGSDRPDATGRTAVHGGQGTTSVLSRPSATPVVPTRRRRSSETPGAAGAGRGGLLGPAGSASGSSSARC